MKSTNRAFLLGAGFSKAIADGPLINDLWSYIEGAYKREENRTDVKPEDKLRVKWFNDLNNFITRLEEEATSRFRSLDPSYKISTEIRENLEYLVTLIDLHLSGPNVRFEKKGSDIQPYPVIPLGFTSQTELEGIRNILQTYFYLVFVRLEGNSLDIEFSKIISPIDGIITFNYDLVLDKALLAAGIWSPLCGYAGVCRFGHNGKKCVLGMQFQPLFCI